MQCILYSVWGVAQRGILPSRATVDRVHVKQIFINIMLLGDAGDWKGYVVTIG